MGTNTQVKKSPAVSEDGGYAMYAAYHPWTLEGWMTDLNNPEYYHRRAWHARQLADRATSPEVKRIHLDLASRYADLYQQRAMMPA